MDRLLYNFAEMVLWWFCTKIVQAIWICQKHGRQGAGLIFPIYLYRKLENSSCQKPLDRFHYNLAKNVSMVTLYQDCSSNCDSSKNMAARGWSSFSLYIYIESLKNSSCQKPLDRFQYNLAEIFPWWPFTKIVQAVMICQKPWLLGRRGLFSLNICIENFKDLLVRNHWTDFNITL